MGRKSTSQEEKERSRKDGKKKKNRRRRQEEERRGEASATQGPQPWRGWGRESREGASRSRGYCVHSEHDVYTGWRLHMKKLVYT